MKVLSLKTKAAAKAFYRESLIESYQKMQPCEPRLAWEELLLNSQNPRHEEIAEFVINRFVKEFRAERRDNGYGCVAVLRNGMRIPFGYNSAIDAPSPKGELKKFFRQVVRGDIQDWKARSYGNSQTIVCSVTHQEVSKAACHVDHIDPTFEAIADEFIQVYQLEEELEFISFSNTQVPGIKAIDSAHSWIGDEFQRWHSHKTKIHSRESFAHLRLISAAANLSRSRSKERA